MNNPIRNGNFTSSEIVALTTFDKSGKKPGAPFYKYIEECNAERRLGRSITKEINALATSWGHLCEFYVHNNPNLLGLDYKYQSNQTLSHPTVSCWKGSPDHTHIFQESHLDAACDTKCPYTLESFVKLVQPLYDGLEGLQYFDAIRNGYTDKYGKKHDPHKDGEKFYWQIVSNSCIARTKYGELIIFCPYQSELDAIRRMADGRAEFYRFWQMPDEQLPYLVDGGYYKNINKVRFEVPHADKFFLHSRVELAAKELIPFETVVPSEQVTF